MQDRQKAKSKRGARKQIWLGVFYSALSGTAAEVYKVATGPAGQARAASELVEAARLLADAAVKAEFE